MSPHPRRLAATAALALAFFPSASYGQQRVQETITVTAAATPVPFDALSRTVRVITREELARLPLASVADVLRLAGGVDVRARGSHGVQTDFALRGGNFNQALVLIDGVRLNDSQSAHHNGDLPVTLDRIERVEVLLGPGSSLHGADAFGGTINIVTKRVSPATRASASVGEHGLATGAFSTGFRIGRVQQALDVSASRSSGFMFDREFRVVTATGRTDLGPRHSVTLGYVDKAFGANQFYGNSPSKEWTGQLLAAVERRSASSDGRGTSARAWYRTHRDRFLWDVRRPGFFENRHRTHAGGLRVQHHAAISTAWRVSGGLEQAADWIRSSNLGDHDLLRTGAFVELQGTVGARTALASGLRFDYYSTFGPAWSPSVSASAWLSSAWRLRGSLAHAFRVPTFTERFYRDPAHRANADLEPERAWGGEIALDWLPHAQWLATVSVFDRRERDVIDWVKARPADLWQTRNIRRVTVRGVEAGVRRSFGPGILTSVDYTFTDVDPASLDLISKYTLDYARHALAVGGSAPLGFGLALGGRLDARQRTGRPTYALVDLRLSRVAGPALFFLEGSNLLDARYEEIRGVAMPGRWVRAGIEVTFR